MKNLQDFLSVLRKKKLLKDVFCPVDPNLELAEIHRRIICDGGPALLFHNVKGSSFPVVTNLYGTQERTDLAFSSAPDDLFDKVLSLTESFSFSLDFFWKNRYLLKRFLSIGTKKSYFSLLKKNLQKSPNLYQLPLIKSWPEDGGSFITLPLVYTESPLSGVPNLGMYRLQRFDKHTLGLHFQIQKGGGFHYQEAEKLNIPLPVSIFLGGPPALMLAAIAPLPEKASELLLASFLLCKKINFFKTSFPYPIFSDCEFALLGYAPPHERKEEGPFGDHLGYYSLKHLFPLFKCSYMYHKKNAIYPATIVGKPRQEDFYLGNKIQTFLSPILSKLMPGIVNLHSYGDAGFHPLSAAQITERYERQSLSLAFRILGEGQLSLTKFLLMTDQNVPLNDIKTTLIAVLERFNPKYDLRIFAHTSQDTLDYTGREYCKGSKGVLIGLGKKIRNLPTTYNAQDTIPGIKNIKAFCSGCLLLEPYHKDFFSLEQLIDNPFLKPWPLVILVNSVSSATKDNISFLWEVFTRFDPAFDISAKTLLTCHNLEYSLPIVINALMKPYYPKEVQSDEITSSIVDKKWKTYFQ